MALVVSVPVAVSWIRNGLMDRGAWQFTLHRFILERRLTKAEAVLTFISDLPCSP
jgi:hypothetical protein